MLEEGRAEPDPATVRNPRLYQAARAEAAKTVPTGTRLFWKKTLDHYQRLGGRLATNDEQEQET